MPPTEQRSGNVTRALVAWQDNGDELALESLIAATCAELKRLAAVWLRRQGVADRTAVDDTLSLVFDHLRRLRGAVPGERPVAPFDAARISCGRHLDAGTAYLAWLVRERALDVARHRRRRANHVRSISAGMIPAKRWADPPDIQEDDDDARARFHTAVARLEPRLRTVVDLLLEDRTQAVIAHVLGVCEGTVSRLRARAIAELRRMMDK